MIYLLVLICMKLPHGTSRCALHYSNLSSKHRCPWTHLSRPAQNASQCKYGPSFLYKVICIFRAIGVHLSIFQHCWLHCDFWCLIRMPMTRLMSTLSGSNIYSLLRFIAVGIWI
jgi:hypothetical protein